ncbi:MAG: Crp/Fnr family transcriptional regulator [Sphingosinicella sp.]
MPNAFVRKLTQFAPLGDEEISALVRLCEPADLRNAGDDLVCEGDRPQHVYLLLDGWGYRYKFGRDGGRQIVAFLVPGDLCDIKAFLLDRMDHSIGLLSEARVRAIPAIELIELMDRFPMIERALWWASLVDEATLREWLLNIGQRDAFERIAHLFCELWVRLQVVGLVDADDAFDLPLTQEGLGDTTGLTPVHVNRTLQRLRREKLIATRRGHIEICDPRRLAEVSGFSRNYLHLTRDGPLDINLRQRLNSRNGPVGAAGH